MNRSRLAALSAGAMFLVASVLVPTAALAAGTGTVSLSPATVSTSTGSTFTVTITTQADTATSGASAALDFDATKLQIVSAAKGAGWNVGTASWVFPTIADIATANSTGHLKSIGAFFTDGTSLPAATPEVLGTVTFFAIQPGTPSISITSSGAQKASLIDGTAASYGSPVATSVANGSAAVTITSSGSANGSVSANVTGSVAAPSLALTCPPSVTVPLVRNVNNQAGFSCLVASDGAWAMSVKDSNPGTTHGFLVDSSQNPAPSLAQPLHLVSSTTDVNLAGSPNLFPLIAGSANVNVPLTFTQVVSPGDKAGSYGMSVLFSIVNTF